MTPNSGTATINWHDEQRERQRVFEAKQLIDLESNDAIEASTRTDAGEIDPEDDAVVFSMEELNHVHYGNVRR